MHGETARLPYNPYRRFVSYYFLAILGGEALPADAPVNPGGRRWFDSTTTPLARPFPHTCADTRAISFGGQCAPLRSNARPASRLRKSHTSTAASARP